MGAAFFVVLDKQVEGLDVTVDGKMLASAEKKLTKAAAKSGVRPLTDFLSANPEELGAFLEDMQVGDAPIPDEQWFAAEEGLETVEALLVAAEADKALQRAKTDLLDLQRVLKAAQAAGVRWHLALDI